MGRSRDGERSGFDHGYTALEMAQTGVETEEERKDNFGNSEEGPKGVLGRWTIH